MSDFYKLFDNNLKFISKQNIAVIIYLQLLLFDIYVKYHVANEKIDFTRYLIEYDRMIYYFLKKRIR
jgi:hypothetical protein